MTDAIREIIQREIDGVATSAEVRAGINLVQIEGRLTECETNLHVILHIAKTILRWRQLYEDGELSADGAMEQIGLDAQRILDRGKPE